MPERTQREAALQFAADLLCIMRAIENARAVSEVSAIVISACRPHRYEHILLQNSPPEGGRGSEIAFCNWDAGWISQTHQLRSRYSLSAAHPVSAPHHWRLEDSCLEQNFFGVNAPAFQSGLIVPVVTQEGSFGIGAILSGRDVDQHPLVLQKLCAVALIALDRLCCLARARQTRNLEQLSPRETEVLTWTARGKSASDIATIIGISHVTANKHVSAAMRKLNASNKAHAVAKALLFGLIALEFEHNQHGRRVAIND